MLYVCVQSTGALNEYIHNFVNINDNTKQIMKNVPEKIGTLEMLCFDQICIFLLQRWRF